MKVLGAVLSDGLTVDDALERESSALALESRDQGFLHTIVLTTLRHKGEIEAILAEHLSKPVPRKSGGTNLILMTGVAQLLFLESPPHAVIDLAVRTARLDRDALHFAGLINAVLRKVSAGGKEALASTDTAKVNTPGWLWQRWLQQYGDKVTRRIAAAHLDQPPLDIAIKTDPAAWAERLGGTRLPTGPIRLGAGVGAVSALPGFAEGAWWVQDAAAGLPVVLLGNVEGKTVLDLCAAPGGKTMQLAAAGAQVTAVDNSKGRIQRLKDNLRRTGLRAEVVNGDVTNLEGLGNFDIVLLDAPCSATGTIRRHPELPYLKAAAQISELAAAQRVMLSTAADHVLPGGLLVYCTCSLEREEGEDQVGWFRSFRPEFELVPFDPAKFGLPAKFVSTDGWLRTLPHYSIGSETGLDGFFAALLRRKP